VTRFYFEKKEMALSMLLGHLNITPQRVKA
jgi:hypothetical protein